MNIYYSTEDYPVKVFCPSCGASFEADGSKSIMYCGECGTQIPVPVTSPYSIPSSQQEKPKKKKSSLLYGLLVILAVALGIGVYYIFLSPVYITDISMTKSSETVILGDEYTVHYTLFPADYRFDSLTWTSDDETVATVSDGVIKAVGGGSCTVTAESKNGVRQSIRIAVEILPEKLILSQTDIEINVGSTATVSVSFKPENTTDKHCIWESDNKQVATVKDGIITAVSEGSCVITVTSEKGDCSAECRVKVKKPSPDEAVTGTWNAYMNYNPATDRWTRQTDNTLIINSDGTAAEYIGEKSYDFTWKYVETVDGNYTYTFTFNDGSTLDGCYFTYGDAKGTFALYTGQGIIIAFESATITI